MHEVVLIVHIVAGAVGLLVGPAAMAAGTHALRAGDRPHGPWTGAYPWVVGVVACSAVVLVTAYRQDLLWLAPIALASWSLAIVGDRAPHRRWRGWSHWYTHGIGGSYVALATAFVVVALTVDGPVRGSATIAPWLVPTVVGTTFIERWRRRLTARSPTG